MVAKGRGLAFVAVHLGALYALDGIVGHGVPVAQIFKKRSQRRQAVPVRGAGCGKAGRGRV
jgi:hypothetical protein